MFAGVIKKQTSLDGYITNGLVETDKIQARHDALAAEMEKRGYNHASPMVCPPVATEGKIDAEANLRELARRCPDCATLQNRMGP
jgi:hypothetical protein